MSARPERKTVFTAAAGFRDSYRKWVVGNAKAESAYRSFLECKAAHPPARLPGGMRDHALEGKLKGIRECHLDGDVLLLYTHENDRLHMLALCRHDDLRGGKGTALAGKIRGQA